MDTKALRNLALVGHGSTGKTTLADALIYECGNASRLGRPGEGTSLFDYLEEEQERKITIASALAAGEFEGHQVALTDTPGYADFYGEVCGALGVCESAGLVVCAYMGVEVQTERVWRQIQELGKPCLVIINKIDAERSDFAGVLEQLRNDLGMTAAPLVVPWGEQDQLQGVVDVVEQVAYKYEGGKGSQTDVPADLSDALRVYREALVEAAAEGEDELMEKFFEEESLTDAEVRRGLTKAIAAGSCVPVVCCSAEKQVGLDRVLKAVVGCMPSPDVVAPEITGTKPDSDEEVTRRCAADEPFSGVVFKTVSDPYVGRLTYFRVCSGSIRSDSQVHNSVRGERERLAQLFRPHGKEMQPLGQAVAGELIAVAKLEHTLTGDTLCTAEEPIVLVGPKFPEPTLSLSIRAVNRGEEDKLGTALTRLAEEDPTFQWRRDGVTNETIVTGMADLHVAIMCKRMQDKFGVEVETDTPRIAYRETIRTTASAQGRHKKQSGGRGQFGDTWIEVSPKGRDEGFEFVNAIVGGVIPGKFIPSVQKGVEEAMTQGFLAGYPLVDVQVKLYDGSNHAVDSSDIAFKLAGAIGLRNAVEKAQPYLLEPVMELEVHVPDEAAGAVIGDLNGKRGRILGVDPEGGMQTVRAQVPLAEVQRYTTDLRSLSSGRGTFSMKFSGYEEVPAHLTDSIVAEAKRRKEED